MLLVLSLGAPSPAAAAPPCSETVGTVPELRTAVTNANGSGVEYVICVAPGTYRLDPADGHLLFTPGPKVTLAGTGASPDQHILSGDFDGGGTPDVRLIATQRPLVVENLTLEFGNGLDTTGGSFDDGGAIIATANVEIIDSIVRNNTAASDNGGAIYGIAPAAVTVTNSNVSNNSGGFGGAVVSEEAVVITGSTFTANTARLDGGAVIVSGSATIDDSTFDSNVATGAGGAVVSFSAGSTTTVRGSLFTANRSTGGAQVLVPPGGGALNVSGIDQLTIEDSTFENNDAATRGGGVAAQLVPDVVIRRSVFYNNSAPSAGGVNIEFGQATTIEDSSFVLNTASGGDGGGLALGASGSADISGTTFASNLAADEGGAISTVDTALSLVNSTASGNTDSAAGAFIGATGTGGYAVAFDHVTAGAGQGVLANPNAAALDLALTNSVLAGCQLTLATISSSSNNFDTNGGCALAGPGDISGADPGLGALADNGGKTAGAPASTIIVQTLLPLDGSPLIDVAGGALATDQRGVARPMGNGPDIGAVEVEDKVIDPITAADTTVTDEMGVPKQVDLLPLVTAPTTTPVLFEVVSVTPGGGATSVQGSVLTFQRALGFTDDVEVVYRVTDDEGQTAEATVTFTLEPTLPETGSDNRLLALFGIWFVAIGGLLLQTSRRPSVTPRI